MWYHSKVITTINSMNLKYIAMYFIPIAIFSCSNDNENNVLSDEGPKIIDTVFYSPSSVGAFHKSLDCKYIRNSKKEIVFDDSAEASVLGYKPCAFCYSISNDSNPSEASHSLPDSCKKKSRRSKKRVSKPAPRVFLDEPMSVRRANGCD